MRTSLSLACRWALLAATLPILSLTTAARAQVRLDDLAVQYHGTILDEDANLLDIRGPDLDRLYVDLADRVMAQPDVPDVLRQALSALRAPLDPQSGTPQPAPGGPWVDITDLDFLIDDALNGAEAGAQRSEYATLLSILRTAAGDRLQFGSVTTFDALSGNFDRYTERRAFQHVRCTGPGVPQPPDLFHEGWKNKTLVDLKLSMIQTDPGDLFFTPETEVYFYESTDPPGLCALLLRYKHDYEINKAFPRLDLAGVICQSEETKATCFWENRRLSGDGKPEEITLAMMQSDPDTWRISDTWFNSASTALGHDLRDPCHRCHNGNNAFIQYPNKLCFDYNGDTCYGDPYHLQRLIKPVGLPEPQLFDGLTKEPGVRSCIDCHDFGIADKDSKFARESLCDLFQHVIVQQLMPKNAAHAAELNWTGTMPEGTEYRDSVMQLRAYCK